MNGLYEESDLINHPYQCFYYDATSDTLPVAPHWHYYMEIILVLKGKLRIQAENTEYLLSAGELIILHSKTVHAFYSADDAPALVAGLQLDLKNLNFTANFTPSLDNIFQAAEKKALPIIMERTYVEEKQLEVLFRKCISELWNKEYGYQSIIMSEIFQLLIIIVRYWQKHGFSFDSTVYTVEDNYDIYNVLPYISAHLDNELKVSDIAAHCGLSYSYFAKRFQEIYGKSCKKYIEDMRVHKVEELLLFTDFDLTYISQVTGFSDCSHLIKSFKERRGITPKQYRLRNKRKHVGE